MAQSDSGRAKLLTAILLTTIAFVPGQNLTIAQTQGLEPDSAKETLGRIFARKLAYTTASPFFRELHTPHLGKFLPRPWKPRPGEILIDERWALRTKGPEEEPRQFVVEELRSFLVDMGKIQLKDSPSDREALLEHFRGMEGPHSSRVLFA